MSYGAILVGLGAIGMGYDLTDASGQLARTHARALTQSNFFRLLAAVDPDPGKRRIFETRYGVPAYGSLAAALELHRPSVAVIACPTADHKETLERVLELATPTAILCEKPLALDLPSAERMVRACAECGVPLYVNYQRRADPAVKAVERMVKRGEMLPPFKGVVWYSKGLTHNGSHFLDLLRFWLGAPHSATLIHAGRHWDEHDPEPDFCLEYALGSMSFFAAWEERFSHYGLELMAQNGRLRYERGGERVEWQGVSADPAFPGYRVLDPEPRLLPADMLRSQLNVASELHRALEGQPAALCTGEQGLEVLRDVNHVIDLL